MSSDPLLQPYKIKHLTLKNRIMTTSHEPAYPVDGMPKDLYRAYHVERAKAGVALTMTAGSAAHALLAFTPAQMRPGVWLGQAFLATVNKKPFADWIG